MGQVAVTQHCYQSQNEDTGSQQQQQYQRQQYHDLDVGHDALPQTVFDMEIEEDEDGFEDSFVPDSVRNLVVLVKNLTTTTDILEQKIRQDVEEVIQEMNNGCLTRNSRYDLSIVGAKLKAMGHDVRVRTAEGGGREYLRQLHYQFLYIVSKVAKKAFIIDPNFKSNFCITCTSPEFRTLLSHVPETFVGQASQLKGLIRLLCGQVEKCFADEGIYTPPWRKESAMLTKWFPTRRFDMEVQNGFGSCAEKDSRPSSKSSSESFSFRLITGFDLQNSQANNNNNNKQKNDSTFFDVVQ
eukprot:TRINITY_DN2180_c0_g1_i4.p1 TRINITY_DN2180_c0_g1~~TRINITY_DN2180_c0_g1_i4.p1  ORF type:complete len:297 (-),score=49.59 TRINITY_DN2180_c0_g1_i4:1571-2461(-)